MKLFLIWQDVNDDWDTHDSAVVVAPDEETARNMDPANGLPVDWNCDWISRRWVSNPDDVQVDYLGEAADGLESCVICASFNAG